MNIEQDFGTRVKYLRTRKGWTQDDLAKDLVTRIERQSPKLKKESEE